MYMKSLNAKTNISICTNLRYLQIKAAEKQKIIRKYVIFLTLTSKIFPVM